MQLLLPVSINSSQTFDSFISQSDDVMRQELNRTILDESFHCIYLAGTQGVGKTHLLSASCHYAAQHGKSTILLPMEQMIDGSTELILGLEEIDLVCIDNIELIQGKGEWQRAIFNLYNALIQNKSTLLISANQTPSQITIELPDLASRLQWATIFQIPQLSEDDKIVALTHHAHLMGFELSEEVAKFMLSRLPRKMEFLMQALNTLAKQSIEKQRIVTVPFVKEVLEV